MDVPMLRDDEPVIIGVDLAGRDDQTAVAVVEKAAPPDDKIALHVTNTSPNRISASEFAKVVSALSGLDRKITRPKLTEAQEKCMPKFNNGPCFDHRIPLDRIFTGPEHRVMWDPAKPRPAARPAAPANPHPLQRLAEPPSVFGQSLWRPWEK